MKILQKLNGKILKFVQVYRFLSNHCRLSKKKVDMLEFKDLIKQRSKMAMNHSEYISLWSSILHKLKQHFLNVNCLEKRAKILIQRLSTCEDQKS